MYENTKATKEHQRQLQGEKGVDTTMWQVDKDFINPKQQETDPTTYFEKFKAMEKAVEELNQTANGHAIVEISCKDQNISADGLVPAEAMKYITDGKERNLGMQLIMNVDCNKYGTLIKDYDGEYLGKINRYQKSLQDT